MESGERNLYSSKTINHNFPMKSNEIRLKTNNRGIISHSILQTVESLEEYARGTINLYSFCGGS